MSSSRVKHLHWFHFWHWLGWCWVIIACYLFLAPSPPVPELGFEYQDKLGHVIIYTILMAWFGNLYHTRRARIFYAVFFVIMGIALEFLQDMGQDRLFEYTDMLANTVGVILGYILTLGAMRHMLHRIERHLRISTHHEQR
jgi:VanZ family protein